MVLCENRVDGFGPQSTFDSHLPTTCFTDVIVVPLATWTYLVVLVISVILLRASSPAPRSTPRLPASGDASKGATTPTTKDASIAVEMTGATAKVSRSPGILRRVLKTLYYFLIVATIAMFSLEIARLSAAQLGIGLLPFTYVGILTVGSLHVLTEPRVARRLKLQAGRSGGLSNTRWKLVVKAVNGFFWVLLTVTVAIKIAVEIKEQHVVGKRTGQQAQYPLSDEIIDDATLIGVQGVLIFLELVTA